ncbi:MAG: chemotaxis protein CheW [Bordetella sp.]|uniref:chemotaxis protein CheW n=1 Tax=Bordetella sp. TaxID=28081 RepID=UPI003F7C4F97
MGNPTDGRNAAAVEADESSDADHAQYLTFMLNRETFGIGILSVREIIEYSTLTQVPLMPACICGVINLRGAVVPVMNLATRLGRQSAPVTKYTCIVIVEIEQPDGLQVIGMMVDAVNAVLCIPPGDIEPAPRFGTHIRADFIAGMGKVGEKFVILLKTDSVLSIDEISALAQLPAPGSPEALTAAAQ